MNELQKKMGLKKDYSPPSTYSQTKRNDSLQILMKLNYGGNTKNDGKITAEERKKYQILLAQILPHVSSAFASRIVNAVSRHLLFHNRSCQAALVAR